MRIPRSQLMATLGGVDGRCRPSPARRGHPPRLPSRPARGARGAGPEIRSGGQDSQHRGNAFFGVGLIDEDVILVDASRVSVQAITARSFSANLGPVAPGVVLARGWVTAAVTVEGRGYAVASTHSEPGGLPGLDQLRAAQAAELVQTLPANVPTVLMGDRNDVPGSPMYQVIAGAGFTDLWPALRGSAA